LLETTALCQEITGKQVPIGMVTEDRPGDLPLYITDNAKVTAATGWVPKRSAVDVLSDLHQWALPRLDVLRGILEGYA